MVQTHNLTVSKTLDLPLDTVTQTLAILGKRGVGKTNTSVVLTEEMLTAGQHVVVIDPLDVWFGLRSSASGTATGFPITVLGGNHGDLPLESTAGALIADFAVERQASMILSLRHFSNSEQRRFVTDFAERLFHRKGEPGRNQPLHLVLDEADEYVPQRIMAGQERMFGAIDRIVRRGRASGMGVTLISQRAAVVNKDVLTQIELLVCHRTVSPQDRKALEAWIDAHDARNQRGAFMESLASLAVGEAWFWCPGWLDIFDRVKVRARKTFDSSATPKAGTVTAEPKKLAEVDLGHLRAQMAATIESAKANDPKELRRRIAELEKAERPTVDPEAVAQTERRAYDRGYADGCRKASDLIATRWSGADDHLRAASQAMGEAFLDAIRQYPVAAPTPPVAPPRAKSAPPRATQPGSNLSTPERRILTVLAQRPEGVEVDRLAILSGYTVNGHFNNQCGGLRAKEYITPARVTPICITREGARALGDFEPLPTGKDLQTYWLQRLSAPEQRILRVLFDRYPREVTVDELAERAGYTVNGHFNNMMGSLRTKGLISPARMPIRASEDFFEA